MFRCCQWTCRWRLKPVDNKRRGKQSEETFDWRSEDLGVCPATPTHVTGEWELAAARPHNLQLITAVVVDIHLHWAGKAAASPSVSLSRRSGSSRRAQSGPQTIRREKLYDRHTQPAGEGASGALTASAAWSAGSCRKVITERLIMTRRKLAS